MKRLKRAVTLLVLAMAFVMAAGNIPAAAPYFVTGPPLEAGAHIGAPLRGARRPRRAVSKPP